MALRYAAAVATAPAGVGMSGKRWDDNAVNDVLKSIRANTSFGGGVKEWKLRLPNGFEIDTQGDTPEHHRQGLEALQQAAALFSAQPLINPVASPPAGPTLAEAMNNYGEIEAKRLPQNTWAQRQRAFKSFSAAIGPGVRVGAISREMASRWADGLIRAGQSEITAKNSTSHVAQLFDALKAKGLTTGENPVKGVVKVSRRDRARRKADGHAWEPFEPEQLKQIFDPKNFQSAGPEHVRWGMLIGLYTGARVGEIAQLFCRDFVVRDKVKCILIRADSDGQSVKTGEAGERLFPIHPDLIALGLWKRVLKIAETQRNENLRLFPGMHIDSKAGKGNSISKGFTYYLGKLGINARRENGTVGMHSLRKTVIQTLQGYKPLPEERRRALMGHEKGESSGDVHSTNYMRPWTAGELRAYEKGLKWGEWLDIDALKPLLETVTLTLRPKPRPSRKPARPNGPG
jgi:integrase